MAALAWLHGCDDVPATDASVAEASFTDGGTSHEDSGPDVVVGDMAVQPDGLPPDHGVIDPDAAEDPDSADAAVPADAAVVPDGGVVPDGAAPA